MAMLVAYFDETGLNSESNVVCVAGLVGTAIEWSRLERPWKNELRRMGVRTFHASKCNKGGKTGHGEYHPKSKEDRSAHVAILCNELIARDLGVIVAAVGKHDWETHAPEEARDRFQTPYHFCFEFVMQKICTWSRVNAGGEPVALLLADHEEFKSRSTEVHEYYYRHYSEIGSLTNGKPKCLIQLQAADLVCHETYRYMLNRLGAAVEPPLSEELTKLMLLLRDPKDAGLYDRENLPAILAVTGALK